MLAATVGKKMRLFEKRSILMRVLFRAPQFCLSKIASLTIPMLLLKTNVAANPADIHIVTFFRSAGLAATLVSLVSLVS